MSPDQKEYEFTLSTDELSLLRKISSTHEELARRLSATETTRGGKLRLRMDQPTAEELRDALTEQLAQRGLAEGYSPTKEGHLLEELIDRFYLPNPPIT